MSLGDLGGFKGVSHPIKVDQRPHRLKDEELEHCTDFCSWWCSSSSHPSLLTLGAAGVAASFWNLEPVYTLLIFILRRDLCADFRLHPLRHKCTLHQIAGWMTQHKQETLLVPLALL